MRKFSKILTVLLTLALLCGVLVSVSALAAEGESREALNVSDASNNWYSDFESTASNGKHYISVGPAWGTYENMAAVVYPKVDGNTYARITAKGFGRQGSGNRENWIEVAKYGWGEHRSGTGNIGAHDYVVIDAEIGTDKYNFTYTVIAPKVTTTVTVTTPAVGEEEPKVNVTTTEKQNVSYTLYKTVFTEEEYKQYLANPALLREFVPKTTTTTSSSTNSTTKVVTKTDVVVDFGETPNITKVNNDFDLAFHDGMAVNINGRAADKLVGGSVNSKELSSVMQMYTVKDPTTGKWYIGNNSVYKDCTKKYELSNKVGEFDHLTWVIKVVRTEDSARTTGYNLNSSRCYMFVNGQYLYDTAAAYSGYDSTSPHTIKISVPQYQDKVAICFDNVAINWYGYRAMETIKDGDTVTAYKYSNVGTVYKSEGYGIDDYITNGDYNSKGLWVCSDIVYNTDYVAPNASKLINVDGSDYYIFGAALDALKEGSTMTVFANVTNVELPSYLNSFIVVAKNGATFSLDPEYAAVYDVMSTVNGDTTTYVFVIDSEELTNSDRFRVTNDTVNNVYTDFNSTIPSSGKGSFGANTNGSSIRRELVVGANGNKYYRQSWSGTYTPKAIENIWVPGNNGAGSVSSPVPGNMGAYDYVTFDFDLGTELYKFTYTATVHHTEIHTCAYQTEENPGCTLKINTNETLTKTYSKTVANEAEYKAYVAEFAKYSAAKVANPDLEKSATFATDYPLISTLIYSYSGTNTARTKCAKAGTYTTETYSILGITAIPDGQTLDLAFADGTGIGYRFNSYSINAENKDWALKNSETQASFGSIKKQADGWYFAGNVKTVKLCNEIGEFDHFTMAFNFTEGGTSAYHSDRKYVNGTAYLFLNGEYVSKATVCTDSKKAEYVLPYSIKITHPLATLNDKGWSIITDNFASNYYKDYDESNTGGIGALIASIKSGKTDVSIYNCNDVLYDKNYADLGGAVSIDGGSSVVFIDKLVAEELNKLTDGGTVITNRNITDFTPKDGLKSFTVELLGGAKFTLSAAAKADLWVIANVDNDTLTVKQLTMDDAITFEFVYGGKVINTQYLLPGVALDAAYASESLGEVLDLETGKVLKATAWMIGDVNANDFVLEYSENMEKKITVTPVISEVTTIDTYVIYTIDEYGFAKVVGAYGDYDSMDSFKANIEKAPDGATAILFYDLNTRYDIGVQTQIGAIAIGAGKTFSLDLNGRTLVDGYSSKDVGVYGGVDGCGFRVYEGSTFNFYSSREGAQWYQLKYATGGDGKVYSKGIVTSEGVKKATVNFGNVYDEKGNLVIKSEDFSVHGSLVLANQASGATIENTNFKVNVNGGNYYGFGAGRYGMIVSRLPVMNVNISNANIYNESAYTAFGIIANAEPDSIKASNTYVNIYNSTIVSPTANLITNHERVTDSFYTEVYVENSTLLLPGLANSSGSEKITLGAGNTISGFSSAAATIAEGVSVSDADINTSVLLHYPRPKSVPATSTDANSFKAEVINGTTYYTIADELYNTANWKNTYKYYSNAYITYKGEMPDVITNVNYSVAGQSFATIKWHKNSADIKVEHPTTYDAGMYIANNLTWKDNGNYNYVLEDYTVAGSFDGMLSNATLSSGLTYNIYVPAEAGVTLTGVNVGTISDKLYEYEGKKYYVISVDVEAKSFDASNISVTFSTPSILGGDAKVGTQTLVADVVGYATKVVNTYKCGSAEATLIYEMMNYKEEVAKLIDLMDGKTYARNDATTKFFAIFAGHADCTCGVEIKFSASEKAEISALAAKGIKGAGFDMVEVGVISMVLASDDPDLAVSVSYFDGLNTKTVIATYNEGYYVTEGIPAAYIDNVMTITVDGATGTYCLAAYINSDGVPAEAKVVAEALYKYAMAAEAYKHIVKAQ